MSQPLNVLFITPDQWRWDALSALGGGIPRTPRLDALAAEGVLFGTHFAQCTPCGPSRASLLTGMYMMNHRSVRNGSPLDARFTNIALEARKAGYDPSLIGYTDTSLDPRLHHPDDPVWRRGYEGVLPGFTPLLLMPTDPWEWFRHLESKGYELPERPYDVYGPEGGHPAVGGFGPYDAPARYRAEDSDTAFSADRAMRFVTENRHQPWFLHLVFLRPHSPYIAPAPYHRMYDPAAGPGFERAADPGDEARQHPFIAFRQRSRGAVAEMSESEIRQLRAAYYGLVSEVDDNIGRIVERLKATGQYDKTLIVVTSDHGDLLGDHWLVGKETFYDQAFHVPAIVRVPGAAWDGGRGRVVEAFTESVDLMPTILDLIGRAVPDQCDGHSLSPFLRGENPASWRSAAFWEYDFRQVENDEAEVELGLAFDECNLAVIRDRRYKYVHFAGLPPLLYDLERDPGELRDRAADPDYAEIVRDRAQRMLSLRMAHVDRALTGIKLTTRGRFEIERARRRAPAR